MSSIFIDGNRFEVRDGQNLLQAALSLGFDLPYFCWHPALGSVGACRQCAVKLFRDEKDTKGKLVMACMTPAADGVRVSLADPEAKEFRAGVAEWLMTNHPHDCPVCDEGGECHLQDMTVMTGYNYRRFRFDKRTFRNQDLGPFINHEMNRCIACYRCVRFYNDYAGGKDFNVFAIHNEVFFGRHEDGVLENEFSGNLVEVCPTGVFTDKTFKKHFTRKWDLQSAPSICQQCGLGCNTIPGERYGLLRRIRNRYNHEVNGYFLCDRGRYGYEFVNSDKRIREALVRQSDSVEPKRVAKDIALEQLKTSLHNSRGVVGIGSPRASLESNFALRSLVGADRFSSGISDHESKLASTILRILRNAPMRSASLLDVEQSDAVLILGEDVTNTAPRIALSLRQAVRKQPKPDAVKSGIPEWHDTALRELQQDKSGPLYIAVPFETKLDEVGTKTFYAAPEEIARLGFAVAHELDPASPKVDHLSESTAEMAREVAGVMKGAKHPLVVSGTSLMNESIIEAAANVARALCNEQRTACICYTVPEANTLGVTFLQGKNLDETFELAEKGLVDTVVIVENDLYRRVDKERVDRFLNSMKHVVVIDYLENETTAASDILLPASTFAEGSGTFVSSEGRAQRFFQVFVAKGEIQESWRWIRDEMIVAGRLNAHEWRTLDEVLDAVATVVPELEEIRGAAPGADFRVEGQKIPRASHRYSGRTAMNANISVSEPKPPEDPNSPLAFSMEGFPGEPPASLTPFFWSPGWNSVQATNKYQIEIAGSTRGGDAGVRLLEPTKDGSALYFDRIPSPFSRQEGQWLIVPLHHIFGSEELSVVSPGVAERSPAPYIALSPHDAAALKAEEAVEIEISMNGRKLRLPLVYHTGLPDGIAALPVGLPGLLFSGLPVWCKLSPGVLQ